MNLLLRILIIAVLGSLAQMYFPWWSFVVIALVVEAAIGKGAGYSAFFSGFYGVALPWMILATYIDMKSGSILTDKILILFNMPQFSILMIIITGLVGGLVGGIGSLTGGWIKDAILQSDGK